MPIEQRPPSGARAAHPSGAHPSGAHPSGASVEALAVLAVVALAAGVVSVLAWTRPARRAASLGFTQSGQVGYGAPTPPGSAYGGRPVTTGEPVYGAAVSDLHVSYRYQLSSTAPATLRGSERLVATVGDGRGLSRVLPLAARASFRGTRFVAHGTLALPALQRVVDAFERTAGLQAPSAYVVTVSASVRLRGRLGGEALRTSFDRGASLSYAPGPQGATGTLVPGPSGGGSSPAGAATAASETPAAALAVSAGGSVVEPGGTPAALALGVSVGAARSAALGVLAADLLLLGLLGRRLLRDAGSDDERVRILARHAGSVVEVAALPRGAGLATVELSSFEGLRQIARRLECPILCRRGARSDTYGVVDHGTLYRYVAAAPPHEDEDEDEVTTIGGGDVGTVASSAGSAG